KKAAILLVSEDLEEIIQLSDRIGVMYRGEFMGILESEEADAEKIGLMMGGVKT
ncbi:MAG: heme ABC transporter ATP-binding protein, partial [Candidatus Bathyarchaeia archaeon]